MVCIFFSEFGSNNVKRVHMKSKNPTILDLRKKFPHEVFYVRRGETRSVRVPDGFKLSSGDYVLGLNKTVMCLCRNCAKRFLSEKGYKCIRILYPDKEDPLMPDLRSFRARRSGELVYGILYRDYRSIIQVALTTRSVAESVKP